MVGSRIDKSGLREQMKIFSCVKGTVLQLSNKDKIDEISKYRDQLYD
jgi:hypothetical protein